MQVIHGALESTGFNAPWKRTIVLRIAIRSAFRLPHDCFLTQIRGFYYREHGPDRFFDSVTRLQRKYRLRRTRAKRRIHGTPT